MSQPRPTPLDAQPRQPTFTTPATAQRPSSLVICDPQGAHLFSGESLLGVQLGALRVGPRRRGARDGAERG